MLEEFGPFRVAFDKTREDVPGHLALLNLFSDDVPEELRRIQRVVRGEPDAPIYIDRLLSDANWRPHLVAAAAILFSPKPTRHHSRLWAAIDAGSWVTPQLVVTAYLSDTGFIERAMSRVSRRCPVIVPGGLSPVERHSATGPGGTVDRSAKMMASLVAVCEQIGSIRSWLDEEISKRDATKLISADFDGSGAIVEDWLKSVVTHFQSLGVKLEPAVQ